ATRSGIPAAMDTTVWKTVRAVRRVESDMRVISLLVVLVSPVGPTVLAVVSSVVGQAVATVEVRLDLVLRLAGHLAVADGARVDVVGEAFGGGPQPCREARLAEGEDDGVALGRGPGVDVDVDDASAVVGASARGDAPGVVGALGEVDRHARPGGGQLQ